MNMGYISDTARNRTHNLFRPKREPIPLGHKDGQTVIDDVIVDEFVDVVYVSLLMLFMKLVMMLLLMLLLLILLKLLLIFS